MREYQSETFGPLDIKESAPVAILEKALKSLPGLVISRTKDQYTLDTNACDKQIGVVLLQKQEDGNNRSIGYWPRTLNEKEQKLVKTHRECLAVIWTLTHLRLCLEGTRFTIPTDHEALRWILSMTEATGKPARWRLRLTEFEIDIVHRAGVKRKAADALSRLNTKGVDCPPMVDEVPVLAIPPKSFACAPSPVEQELKNH